jgi:hypothetical protein
MRAEEEEAARMPQVARNMPSVAADIGKSFVDAYKQRSLDLQDLANRQAGGAFGMYQPLSDYGEDPRAAELARAQRDLALDVLSAGAMGPATSASMGMLSSAPGIGGSTARNAGMDVLARLRQNPLFANVSEIDPAEATYRQFGATVPEARAALSEQLQARALRPEIQSVQQNPVLHSSPHFFLDPRIDPSTAKTGEGHQMWGPGLYVAESPGTASSYRESLRKYFGSPTLAGIPFDPFAVSQLRQDPRYKEFVDRLIGPRTNIWNPDDRKAIGKIEDFQRNPARGSRTANREDVKFDLSNIGMWESFVRDAEERVREVAEAIRTGRTWFGTDAPAFTEADLKRQIKSAQENKNYLKEAKVRYRKTLASFNEGQSLEQKALRARLPEASTVTYTGTFGANPNEILNLTEPYFGFGGISGTPFERAILNLSQGDSRLANYEETMRELVDRTRELPIGISFEDYKNLDYNDPIKNQARQLESDITQTQQNLIKGFEPSFRRSVRDLDPNDIMRAMMDQGIVGTKFPDALSRGFNVLKPTDMARSEMPSFNYTIYDPNRIQFEDAFAANPLLPLSSVMSQMQKDKEKKKK